MSDEQITSLLEQADEAAGAPSFEPVAVERIRRRVRRRRLVRVGVPATAAAAVLVATGLIALWTRLPELQPQPEQQIASLEEQVRQLQAQTDATLRLVHEVLERDRQERRLAQREAELASIPDPMQELEKQVDKTAFILLYQADRLYKELNQTESAVAAYKEVIQLFPKNRWAEVARERLSQIEQRQFNKSNIQGEQPCEPPTV